MVVCDSTQEVEFKKCLELIKDVGGHSVLVLQPNSSQAHDDLLRKLERWQEMSNQEGVTACVISQMHKVVGIK